MQNKWFAFQAIALGILLGFLQQRQMIFGLIALALLLYGTIRLAEQSVWLRRADWCATVLVPLTVLRQLSLPFAAGIGAVLAAGWLVLGLLVARGMVELMRRADERPTVEWLVFAVWVLYAALTAACGIGALCGQEKLFSAVPLNTVAVFAHIALLLDTFRVQREYIGGNNE